MKKSLKIFLGIVVFLFLIAAVLAAWQWDNLSALYIGLTTDETDIQLKIEENKKKLAEINNDGKIFGDKVIEGFSKEDEEKIASGEISAEEAVEKLFEEEPQTTPGEETPVVENESEGVKEPEPAEETTENEIDIKEKELLQTAVKELYVLKADFTKKLADLEREGKKMYIADNGKNMTTENKLKIADYLMPKFVQAEKDCDAKVEVVLQTLSDGLKEIGKNTEIVETIRNQYNEEKKLKKAQYIKDYL